MSYELSETLKMIKVYHELESAAQEFLFISGFALKHKEKRFKSAQRTLKAIQEFKKLPIELKNELEKEPDTYAKSIIDLEKLCKKAISEIK
jgi:hypothetical protein